LTDDEIDQIVPTMRTYRRANLVPTPLGKLERIAATYGVPFTPVNAAQAQSIYFRALSAS